MATGLSGGDREARRAAPPIDDIYLEHRRRVFGICLNYLGNVEDAEDATQETFVKAARHLVGFEGNVAAYLTVVARNVCCDEVRRRQLQRRTAGRLGRDGGGVEIESRAVDRSVLSRLLPRLTHGERELLLHNFAGYSYDEIADRTGAPVGTVRVRLARARKRARGLAGGLAGLGVAALLQRLRRGAERASRLPGALAGAADQAALVSGAVATSVIAAAVGGGGLGTTVASRPQPARAVAAAGGAVLPLTGAMATPSGSAGASSGSPGPGGSAAGSGSAAGPARAAGGTGGTAPVVGVAPQGTEVQPQQAWYDGIAASPASSSGPIFAWGHTGATCNGPCELLFRSDDAGRSWQNLQASGLLPGRVYVPPTFPADPTLFAVTAGGVLLSHDGGVTWGQAPGAPAGIGAGAAAAVLPVAGGHPRLAFDTGHLQVDVLDGDSGALSSYAVPPPAVQVTSVGWAGQTLLAAVDVADPTSSAPHARVWVCGSGGACAQAAGSTQAWHSSSLQLQPVAQQPGTALVLDGGARESSTSDGVAFAPETDTGLAASTVLAASARWIAGAAHLLAEVPTAAGAEAALVGAAGGGLLHSLPDGRAAALLLLPGDVILAGGADVDGSSRPGLRCSHDLGATWQAAC